MGEQAVLKNSMGSVRNRKGLTLVEVTIALVVLLFVFMGLLQAALLSIDHNLRNVLRDEAVRIADQRMNGILIPTNVDMSEKDYNSSYGGYNGLRTISLTTLQSMGPPPPNPCIWTAPALVTRTFRNLTKTYSVCWCIRNLDSDTTQIQVAVGWDHKQESTPQQVGTGNAATKAEYVHQITTLRRI